MTRLRNGLLCKLGCVWYRNALPPLPDPQPDCSGVLPLFFYAQKPGFPYSKIGIKIAGRNQVGPFRSGGINCASTDPYVLQSTYTFNFQYCDIWKAYRDAIWSSSITIDIYALEVISTGTILRVSAGYRLDDVEFPGPGTLLASKALGSPGYYTACANTLLVGTLTVNDDGTVSLV